MVKKIILGETESNCLTVEQFVENIVHQFNILVCLDEEHISRNDKLKKYRQYNDGDEVKAELASMLDKFIRKYESSDYVTDVDLYASKSPGLSNYIELTFNVPFGAKEWLKHMIIRASDHPKMNKRKVDEYINLNDKTVADIEKELDRIITKRIRRLEREFNVPMAQNESLRRKRTIKLRINDFV